jgi:cytochrome c oxidase subunit II
MSERARRARKSLAATRRGSNQRQHAIRAASFAFLALLILGGGIALAMGDLFGQRGTPTSALAVAVRASMAGFTPAIIEARPGELVEIDFWTTDSAPHLVGGVHTLISDELGIFETLPAQSRRTIHLTAPSEPGDYDFYCDTCCGGKASPSMHGTLRVSG